MLVLDLSQLRNVTLDDETLMREVVTELVHDTSNRIEKLRQAIERADAHECVRQAHNAHGACGTVGAASMAALFCAVERQAASGDLSPCRASVRDLVIELDKLRIEADAI